MAAAQSRAEKLNGLVVQMTCKAGDGGRLFGSIGTGDIAAAASAAAGIDVNKNEVRMPDGVIRLLGEFEYDLQLHADVVATIKVNVVPE